jgi:hypothetical protein
MREMDTMRHAKRNATRAIALATMGAMTVGTMAATTMPVQAAKSSTWKKVAIGAAAATGYGLLKKNGKITTIGAVATAGSYYMYRRAKKKEARRY